MQYLDDRRDNESWSSYLVRKERGKRKGNKVSPLDKQVGGDHYKHCGIQPVEYIAQNNLDYFEGNVVKYITRHKTKGEGAKDIQKVIHYAELILELTYGEKRK